MSIESQSQTLFEFNRSAPWELFSSAYRAGMEATQAKSPIEKLHHNRATLLFAFASIEAILNSVILSMSSKEEIELRNSVEGKPIRKKLDYIETTLGIVIDRLEIDIILSEYKLFRDQTAHHKRIDQQSQFHAQHVQPLKLIELLQIFFVRSYLAMHGEFPYWVTGWNYIGFNGNWRDPFLSNNGNGFSHTLKRMHFQFRQPHGAGSISFSQAHMSNLNHFREIKAFLDSYEANVEPFSYDFPTRPRLVRTWWKESDLLKIEEEIMDTYRTRSI